jgi:hypothetical protein
MKANIWMCVVVHEEQWWRQGKPMLLPLSSESCLKPFIAHNPSFWYWQILCIVCRITSSVKQIYVILISKSVNNYQDDDTLARIFVNNCLAPLTGCFNILARSRMIGYGYFILLKIYSLYCRFIGFIYNLLFPSRKKWLIYLKGKFVHDPWW